jgi:hypothetical protein
VASSLIALRANANFKRWGFHQSRYREGVPVNLGKKPIANASLFAVPSLHELVNEAGLPPEVEQFQEMYNDLFSEWYSLGMDQAIGIQRSSIQAAARMQSEMIESYKGASWCTPELSDWLDSVATALASCMEWQMAMLAAFVPVSPSLALKSSEPASSEELAHGMDVGTGQRKPRRSPRVRNAG